MSFDPIISALEEIKNIGMIRMDELHGIFASYEMRTEHENPSKKEATFNPSKKTNNNNNTKSNPKSDYSFNDDLDEYEEMANFVRKLKKGTDKYKGNFPLNFLIVVKLVILLINFHMIRTKRMMMKKLLRKKRNIKRETQCKTRRNSSRNIYIQRKIVHH
jgi:hypothetical protein